MTDWAWQLCNEAGLALPGSHVATGRKVALTENRETEAKLTLSVYDAVTEALFAVFANGVPQLRIYRDSVLKFSGLWTPSQGQNKISQQSSVELTFKDAFNVLRYRNTDELVGYTADAGTIAKNLIDQTNTDHGDTTIATDGTIATTLTRDMEYEDKEVGEAIVELTEMDGGFDWYPTYLDPTENSGKTMRFNVSANRGQVRENARFEFGDETKANCTGYGFTLDLPRNRVRALGNGIRAADRTDATSITNFGTYMQILSAGDVIDVEPLEDLAQDALRPGISYRIDMDADPAKSPMLWDDFDIGDTVQANIRDGAVQLSDSMRVVHAALELDDSDNVSSLTVGFDEGAS